MSNQQNNNTNTGSGAGRYGDYDVTGRGVNSEGNRYDTRAESGGTGYHYSNADGSYYYQHGDGSTYHNTGPAAGGHSTYTTPSGHTVQR